MAVRRWRRVLEELAEEEVAKLDRQPAPDPDGVAALLVAALLGGKRARPAGEKLAERIGAQAALRLRDRGGELVGDHLDQVLRAERDRRLAPLEALEVTPEPQAELIAALSVLQKESGMSSHAGISSCRAVSSASSGMTPSSFWRAKVVSRKAFQPSSNSPW